LDRIFYEKSISDIPDFSKEFKLAVDVSEVGVGAVLLQEVKDDIDLPICHFSIKFDIHQKNHSNLYLYLIYLSIVIRVSNLYLYLIYLSIVIRVSNLYLYLIYLSIVIRVSNLYLFYIDYYSYNNGQIYQI
jgi:hypothetical protein